MAKTRRTNSIIKQLNAEQRKHHNKLKKAVTRMAVHLSRKSLDMVPIDLGPLRDSHFVEPQPQTSPSRFEVWVGYKGVDYAIYVHEIAEYRHGKDYNEWYAEDIAAGRKKARGPNQQYKFLERPFRNERRAMDAIFYETMHE